MRTIQRIHATCLQFVEWDIASLPFRLNAPNNRPKNLTCFLSRPQDQLVWLGALALVSLFLLFVIAGTAGAPYAARKWLDTLDHQAATLPRDQRTNVIIGLTIFGLAVIFMNTSKFFTPNLEIFILACVVLFEGDFDDASVAGFWGESSSSSHPG